MKYANVLNKWYNNCQQKLKNGISLEKWLVEVCGERGTESAGPGKVGAGRFLGKVI